jgi:hypothetical protein
MIREVSDVYLTKTKRHAEMKLVYTRLEEELHETFSSLRKR